jgi:hypothetical protein
MTLSFQVWKTSWRGVFCSQERSKRSDFIVYFLLARKLRFFLLGLYHRVPGKWVISRSPGNLPKISSLPLCSHTTFVVRLTFSMTKVSAHAGGYLDSYDFPTFRRIKWDIVFLPERFLDQSLNLRSTVSFHFFLHVWSVVIFVTCPKLFDHISNDEWNSGWLESRRTLVARLPFNDCDQRGSPPLNCSHDLFFFHHGVFIVCLKRESFRYRV